MACLAAMTAKSKNFLFNGIGKLCIFFSKPYLCLTAPEEREMKTRKTGFTLVEILIVVIILGILAAIVIPQFTEASNDARESSLVSNLQTLRSQFELYKVQHLDIYPWDDPATAAVDLDGNLAIIARLTSKTDADGIINAAGAFGPYMQDVPGNPWCTNTPAEFAAAVAADGSVDWIVTVGTGAVADGYPAAH